MLKTEEIKKLIDEDASSQRKQYAKIGNAYYEGEHKIKEYRMFYYNADGDLVEDRTRSNERISHPFFTELADQLTAYILSSPENPIQSTTEGLQEQLDLYFDDEFWAEFSELITGAYVKGFDYLYAYKNEADRTAFEYADGMGVVEVRAKATDDGCDYHIYWYIDRIGKDNQPITRIQVHTTDEIYYYVQQGSGKIELDKERKRNPEPNVIYTDVKSGQEYGSNLGFMPFFRLDYNNKQISGLKPIKALIDDYDLMECGLSNNLQDFDKPIHVVKGFEGNDMDELIQNIRTKKAIGVGENGGLDIMTVNVPYEARKVKADEDEKNIYRFGMGLNTIGLKDTTATTNIAIKMAYTLLDLKAEKFERRIKKFLKKIIQIVLDEINAVNGTDYQLKDVKIEFKHEMIVNEQEATQNEKTKAETKQIVMNYLLSASAYIGDEDTLKQICDILDLDFEEVQAKLPKEDDIKNVQADLNAVIPEGDVIEQ
jgi:SPP1 family phage portal protein